MEIEASNRLPINTTLHSSLRFSLLSLCSSLFSITRSVSLKVEMEEKRIDFAQECKQMVKGILKLIWILEGSPELPFNSKEYMMLYTYPFLSFSFPLCLVRCLQLHHRGNDCDHVYMMVKADAREAVITLINKEREGGQIDRSLLKNIVDIFVEVGLGKLDHYEQDFEIQMLDDTANYYKSKGTIWIEKVHHELFGTNGSQLTRKVYFGFPALLTNDKVEDLSRIYRISQRIPGFFKLLVDLFKEHITAEGTVLIQQEEEAANNQTARGSSIRGHVLIRKIIKAHDKYMAYVNDCFMIDTKFHKALKEAFVIFCNKTVAGCTTAELLAAFCDNILKRRGSERLIDEAIEENLDKVVKLLVYINDKDLFAKYCRKNLARRLLFTPDANEEQERILLSMLKQQLGGNFPLNMERMVNDMILARECQSQFLKHLHNKKIQNLGMDITVTVLTTGSWPTYKTFDLNLPSMMIKCMEVFKRFYDLRYGRKTRRLRWIYSSGTCNVNGNFEPKIIELIVSTSQAVILLLFNNADRLSYSEIMTRLNLSHEDAGRLLHSLSCSKYKILNKEPNTKSISPNDIFQYNSKFTDKMRRIKIPITQHEDKRKMVEDLDNDRQYTIDAAIVRIMKSRMVLDYQQLQSECVEMLSPLFKPEIETIKKRIEHLIATDYLERDRDNQNIFKYVA
ncbi:hypothetical protein AHAS_Ahas12G0233800 [Arachis hypogaea]